MQSHRRDAVPEGPSIKPQLFALVSLKILRKYVVLLVIQLRCHVSTQWWYWRSDRRTRMYEPGPCLGEPERTVSHTLAAPGNALLVGRFSVGEYLRFLLWLQGVQSSIP